MIEIETGSANVYADLGRADADEMLVKAHLASKIGDIIKRRKLTQAQAAEILASLSPNCPACCAVNFGGSARRRLWIV